MNPPVHHFENPQAAASDTMLQLCVNQGVVPPGCLLGGATVHGLMQRGEDPCAGCRGPRHRCGGRPFKAEDDAPSGQRLNLGTSVNGERGGKVVAFFLGGDPAPSESHKSDDGGLVASMARPNDPSMTWENLSDNEADWSFAPVWARTLTSVERASARQWSGLIHQLHGLYGFEKIVLDPGGGGLYVQRELKSVRQFFNGSDREVTPIADQVTGPREVTRGYFILHLYKRGDPGIELLWPGLAGDDMLNDAAYSELKSAFDSTSILLPPKLSDLKSSRSELLRQWSPEKIAVLEALNRMVDQCKALTVLTKEGGEGPVFATTRRGARQFEAPVKKDLMSALLYSYLGFRMWLRSEDWKSGIKPQNRAMFSGA